MKDAWEKKLTSEFGYWWWQIKNSLQDIGEMQNRGVSNPPLDLFVSSLIRTSSTKVKILDVGSGPISPVGLASDKHEVEVVAIDALAIEFVQELDNRCVGVGSSLRAIYGLAETLDQQFESESFDGVICWNALDHTADPIEALKQMSKVVKPGGFIHIKCWKDEGSFEDWKGLHQWNFHLVDQEPFLVSKSGTGTPVYSVFDSDWSCEFLETTIVAEKEQITVVMRKGIRNDI